MNKCICDICNNNIADNRFRVKMEKEIVDYEYGHVFPKWKWVDIDICKACYSKFLKLKVDMNIEDIMASLVGNAFDKYEDKALQVAYLEAIDDITAKLIQRKIINGK